ncbi:MAG: nuclear transport factor 2 family protein [Sneathiella sp.]|uniref:nuclear transport factor 2 family protein n=1 Tax=Sneathiella sp. TaxID=1964365 RepID=UPI003001639A
MTPRQIVEEWVKRFNTGDAALIADLYDENAINHQITQDAVEGRNSIQAMFAAEFEAAEMVCIPEIIHEAGDVAILEWRDPIGLRGCGFFTVKNDLIVFQRGYWDKLSFLKLHNLPLE